ncbi:hypothetical protein BDP55DRAFT_634696 [Colletotrichum godetiae]|uniref:Uncharacterized protein n=1 Tax=Colletotrichum godetiae TaxID=1209918 RepID=A0AAJ0EQD3_9PEZI|nr:uncharacterized protein BDP55DRAFT_634696 [Colletotrichum godetiae]KAK1672681.1 hypothetical protein BDP55DRAFT_634696 [Colletotrichum godetiae]
MPTSARSTCRSPKAFFTGLLEAYNVALILTTSRSCPLPYSRPQQDQSTVELAFRNMLPRSAASAASLNEDNRWCLRCLGFYAGVYRAKKKPPANYYCERRHSKGAVAPSNEDYREDQGGHAGGTV